MVIFTKNYILFLNNGNFVDDVAAGAFSEISRGVVESTSFCGFLSVRLDTLELISTLFLSVFVFDLYKCFVQDIVFHEIIFYEFLYLRIDYFFSLDYLIFFEIHHSHFN